MTIDAMIDNLRQDAAFSDCVTRWHVIPAKTAAYAGFPAWMDGRIPDALGKKGITQLYSHQREAVDAIARGEDIVLVTPTASGKTLCYNLPVLNAIIKDETTRAMYLFPTKALSSDQVAELYEFIQAVDVDVKTFTYDGDTPASARKAIRQAGHVVVTNPDMLHSGILPQHTKWVRLFENLKFVVIDEIHAYRGVFGSHLAHVIARLKRLCAFYGSHPQFICCSATIQNPGELAETLTGRKMTLINRSGAPAGEKHIVFYNPPVVNKQLGIRAGAVGQSRAIASRLVSNGVQTIVFARSRLHVEVIVKALKHIVADRLGMSGGVRGYRGGYLPSLRREIEKGLRNGSVRAVVSTNALELGIDIGQLDACVLCGYPGTVASLWQQAGRAGRRMGKSLTVFVATSASLDQYIVTHPEYFLDQSPEQARINPENLFILLSHMKCAAYELPFDDGEIYNGMEQTPELLEHLASQNMLRHVSGKWYWQTEEFPASDVDIRSSMDENFVIFDISKSDTEPRTIGTMDRFTVPMLLHEKALYLHEGQQYQVERLDFPNKKAYVRRVDVDYYTDANLNVSLRVLDVFDTADGPNKAGRAFGEVLITYLVTLFKKFKLDTQENVGWGPVDLPELDMHTTAAWISVPDGTAGLTKDGLQTAMMGLTNILKAIAPIDLMCAAQDIGVVCHVRDPFTELPTIYLYDNCPGGIGLAQALFDKLPLLIERAASVVGECCCENGCPSCVGASAEDPTAKSHTLRLISALVDAP